MLMNYGGVQQYIKWYIKGTRKQANKQTHMENKQIWVPTVVPNAN